MGFQTYLHADENLIYIYVPAKKKCKSSAVNSQGHIWAWESREKNTDSFRLNRETLNILNMKKESSEIFSAHFNGKPLAVITNIQVLRNPRGFEPEDGCGSLVWLHILSVNEPSLQTWWSREIHLEIKQRLHAVLVRNMCTLRMDGDN